LIKQYIDIDKWSRKNHFYHFKQFSDPFFGATVDVDCSIAYRFTKQHNRSFFLHYLHKSLLAVNSVEELTYRIEGDDKIAKYDVIHPAPTVGRDDNTFGFSCFEFDRDYSKFAANGTSAIEKVKASSSLEPGTDPNVVYYSAIPWLQFTSLSHASDNRNPFDSIPRISFGKLYESDGKKIMPMSVHVNHALADGYHVAKYVDLFQQFMNEEA